MLKKRIWQGKGMVSANTIQNNQQMASPFGSSPLDSNGLAPPFPSLPSQPVDWDSGGIKAALLNLNSPCYVLQSSQGISFTHRLPTNTSNNSPSQSTTIAALPPLPLSQWGDAHFLAHHGVAFAYATGAMAGGIASVEMVIALGRRKILSSFGTGGLPLNRIEAAIHQIQQALPHGPYCFNLLHNPHAQLAEQRTVDLFLARGVTTVEASAFLQLTPSIVRYRAAGLSQRGNQAIIKRHKVIAKVSRREVAAKFLQPAPSRILRELVANRLITEQQARLAEQVPMADDITVEADSGGHTDNRPLVCLLPAIQALRDELQSQYRYNTPVRIGVAGGIGTPQSVLAAFSMGAAYVVTGSVNQSCVEAGTSDHTKRLLAGAEMHDVMMSPAADMFEMGVKLQVLKRGTLFPLRAQKLFDLFKAYPSIEAIPAAERKKLEAQVFKRSLDEIWQDTQTYLAQNNPEKLARARENPKLKMASIFRWYLGLSSRWATQGEPGREVDYQIWCGPAMGAFNNWVKGSYLEVLENRHVLDVAVHLMTGAAFLYRLQALEMQGVKLALDNRAYLPHPLAP